MNPEPTPSRLYLETESERVEIELDFDSAPRTVAALISCLPARVDLHCAKVAGDQLLFSLPVVVPSENPRSIQETDPGVLIYYPARQFFEIMFGGLTDEEAIVTVIGKVAGDLGPIRRVGEALQRSHGWSISWANLTVDPMPATHVRGGEPPGSAAVRELRGLREQVWRARPDEIPHLMSHRSATLPLGPLVFAESEVRKLQENLWALRERVSAPGQRALPGGAEARAFVADVGAMLLATSAKLIAGYSGLHDASATLERAACLMTEQPDESLGLLDEALLISGRLAGWLDLCLPWQRLNEVTAQAADAQARVVR